MPRCLFVADLHGRTDRYVKLFQEIASTRPAAVFLGGDLLPAAFGPHEQDAFIADTLVPGFSALRLQLDRAYPHVFIILGNDDLRLHEGAIIEAEGLGIWVYAHQRRVAWSGYSVYGYACVPPTPFQLKDWERYDVSRYVDPSCLSPEEGWRSVPVPPHELKYRTIADDLRMLALEDAHDEAIVLFHTPPYDTKLDRAALDGKAIDHAPLDVHVGSIAVRHFIEAHQPLLTLHGHIHESARITGSWHDRMGRTRMLSAAHDGDELALVRFDPKRPDEAVRDLL